MTFGFLRHTRLLTAVCAITLTACSHNSEIIADTSLTSAAGANTARAAGTALADVTHSRDSYEKHLIIISALEGSSAASTQSQQLINKTINSVIDSFETRRIFLRDLDAAYREFGRLGDNDVSEAFSLSANRLADSLKNYGTSLNKSDLVSKAVNRLTRIAGEAYAGKKIQQANLALGDAIGEAASLIRAERDIYNDIKQEFIRAEADATLALWRKGLLSSSGLTQTLPLLPGFIPTNDKAWTAGACKQQNCAMRRITYMLANRNTDMRLNHEKEALEAISNAFNTLKQAHRDIAEGRPVEGYKLALSVHRLRNYIGEEPDYSDLPPAGGAAHGGKKGLVERLRARFN